MSEIEEKRAAAINMLGERFQGKGMEQAQARAAETGFAKEIGSLALDNVFVNLWSRPGLDMRARSLLTLGILIALRSEDELRIHSVVAINNGLSVEELEEVIYHASGYAGFPAANSARQVAADALLAEGMINPAGK